MQFSRRAKKFFDAKCGAFIGATFLETTQDVITHAWDVNASSCTLETLKHGNHVLVLWHL